MIKLRLQLLAVALASSMTVGCVGLFVAYPTECSSDLPICDYIYEKNKWGPTPRPFRSRTPSVPNRLLPKDSFISKWGEPTERIQVSDYEEILIYKFDIWCGAVPIYILPVPLVAPACEGFDRITFKGDQATHIHFKRGNEGGFVLAPGFIGPVGRERPCPTFCPYPVEMPTELTAEPLQESPQER